MTRTWSIAGLGALALAALFLLSLLAGPVWLSPARLVQGVQSGPDDLASLILFELRLPRTILAVLVGGSLGVCGAVLQALLRNPLADPGLLGVSPGAALGAVIAIYFGLALKFPYVTPILGLVGALAATGMTFALGRGGTLSMILAGAAVSGLAIAGEALALNFAPNPYAAYEITTWIMGSLSDRSWEHVWLAAPFIILGLAILVTTRRALDALALGEAQAASLGVNLDHLRLIILVGVGLCVGAGTAVSGGIGFIGLVAPHLVRPMVGHQPSRTLLPSAIVGAALLLAADIVSRVLRYNGNEIKLGVLTSLIGTPFFFALVRRVGRTAP